MITEETLKKVAHLAKLELNPDDVHMYQQQLSKILDHFEQISTLNTEGVEPLLTPTDIEFQFRPDEVKKSIPTEKLVDCAPEKQGALFKVPPVL